MKDGGILERIRNIKIFKNKHIKIAVIILLVCIASLLFFSSVSLPKKEQQSATKIQTQSSAIEYSKEVGANLQEILSGVKGLTNVKVSVVVESSPTLKYLTIQNRVVQQIRQWLLQNCVQR